MVFEVITTRSRAGVVWFAYDGGAGAEISPETARQFARHLTLHAEKAEILRRRGNGAKVGERESQTGRQTIREAADAARDDLTPVTPRKWNADGSATPAMNAAGQYVATPPDEPTGDLTREEER